MKALCANRGRFPQPNREGGDAMSLIPCTDPCIYQVDGCCTLSRACSGGVATKGQTCLHYIPMTSKQNSQSLPNVFHRNEL